MRVTSRVGLAIAAACMAASLAWAGPASAHVTVSDEAQQADAYTVLTFSVPHGCDGSPTTQVKIRIPESIPQVTPTVNPGWDVSMVKVALDTPATGGHGAPVSERVGEVVYTAKAPLPADLRDAFELSLKTPDAPGETLYFPVLQVCEQGEAAWIEIPSANQPDAELESPAPRITLSAAGGDGIAEGGGAANEAAAPRTETSDGASSGSSNTLAIVALVVGAVGIVLGGAALVTRRRDG